MTQTTEPKEIEVTLFTGTGRALRFKTKDLTLYNAGDSVGALPRLEMVRAITVKTDSLLLDVEDGEGSEENVAYVVT
jgi:hypothetical protein